MTFHSATLKALLFISSAFLPCTLIAVEKDFVPLSEIEQALNPLEVIANHGGIRRSIDLNIQFSVNSASILPTAQRQVKALGNALQGEKLNGCRIRLIGHTDATGDENINMRLSKARAEAVKQALIDNYGIRAKQLDTEGKGETQLLLKLPDNDAKHRRVEIILVDVEACKGKRQVEPQSMQKTKDGSLNIKW